MAAHVAHSNPGTARGRATIEHVFAAREWCLGPVRSIGLARAITALGFANVVSTMRHLLRLETRPAA
jgi:hypothetical protein